MRWLKVLPQYVLPHHLLSACMYRLARLQYPLLNKLMIRAFIRLYDVNMGEAEESDITAYPDFNTFFTRELKPGARRPDADAAAVLSPIDGSISQLGHIQQGHLIQAKGMKYTTLDLLGNDPDAALRFSKGAFITLYLSPGDYHRVHMPLAGNLEKMAYVPGRLFSVSPLTTTNVSRLFARNERIISHFSTFHGQMAVIMVGAIFVGSMQTVWAGQVTPARDRTPESWSYTHLKDPVSLDRAEEMGRFNMGSTVILLFEKNRVEWLESLKPGDRVKMGEKIGKLIN